MDLINCSSSRSEELLYEGHAPTRGLTEGSARASDTTTIVNTDYGDLHVIQRVMCSKKGLKEQFEGYARTAHYGLLWDQHLAVPYYVSICTVLYCTVADGRWMPDAIPRSLPLHV